MIKNVNTQNQTYETAANLLKDLYLENLGNETHIENLQELFLCFVRADDDHRPNRDSIIATYESLKDLLVKSNRMFKSENSI